MTANTNYFQCTTCLKVKTMEEGKSLESKPENYDILTIYDMLLYCVPLLSNTLKTSAWICNNCLKDLYYCVQFIDRCLQSNEELRQRDLNSFQPVVHIEKETEVSTTREVIKENPTESTEIKNEEVIKTELRDKHNVVTDINKSEKKLKTNIFEVILKEDNTNLIAKKIPNLFDQDEKKDKCIKSNKTQEDVKNTDGGKVTCEVYGKKLKTNNCLKRHQTLQNDKVKCDYCGFGFNALKTLKSHLKLVHQIGQSRSSTIRRRKSETQAKHPTCPFCFKVFRRLTAMVRHVVCTNKHANDFPCKFCTNKFTTYMDLKTHLKSHQEIPAFCQKCYTEFDSEELLRKHNEYFGKSENPCGFSTCEKCCKRFWEKEEYENHLLLIDCKYRQCKVCDKKFTEGVFKNHTHEPFICELCGKSFDTKWQYIAHKQSREHTTDSELILCQTCGKSFAPRHINSHIKNIHSDQSNRYTCSYCPKQFYSQYQMKAHEKVHTGVRDVKCKGCNKMFRTRSIMMNHYRNVHLKYKKYKCSECSVQFGLCSNLARHMKIHQRKRMMENLQQPKRVNKGQVQKRKRENRKEERDKCRIYEGMRVKCHFCEKIIRNVQQLRLHVISHLAVRQFKCDLCEMTFVRKYNLQKHLKKHEDPLFKYCCKICFKTQKSQEDYISHSAKHKLDYVCQICSQRFGRKYILECHKASVHPEGDKVYTAKDLFKIALKNAVFIKDDVQ